MSGPTLLTARLELRPPRPEDFDAVVAFLAEEETMRHLGGVQPRSVAWRTFCAWVGAWTVRGYSMFAVIERDSGRWIGRIGPHFPEDWPAPEVGWGVSQAVAGKGYAYEAALAAMDFAFDTLGWDEAIHVIAPENARSAALARRLGSVNRGPTTLPAPHEAARVDRWSQTAGEWRRRR